ncbi:nuclear transport factor 2 family protein [Dyella sp.]|uniref:nuclear transport factor 2 family protein n=1 Tax=Dyella sp. TaxID=1869338 RepID=UPI002ED59CB6
MQQISIEALPDVVRSHVEAINQRHLDALMATLAPDALINDAKREFLGHAAIRAWAREEIIGASVTLGIEKAYAQSGNAIARFRVDGDFDKSKLPDPFVLTYYFTIRSDLITQLIIVHNGKNAS